MKKMKYKLFYVTLILSLSISSCKIDKKIDKIVDREVNKAMAALKEESQAWRKTTVEAAEAFVRAVPGERWLQIIDDLHGADEAKKKEAHAFLKSLMNIDPTLKWTASVHFIYESEDPVRATSFQSPTNQVEHLKIMESEGAFSIDRVKSAYLPKDKLNSYQEQLSSTYNSILNEFFGDAVHDFYYYSKSSISRDARTTTHLDASYSYAGSNADPKFRPTIKMTTDLPNNKILPYREQEIYYPNGPTVQGSTSDWNKFKASMVDYKAERKKMAEKLAEAALIPFSKIVEHTSSDKLSFTWLPATGSPFITIAIRKSDYQKIKDKDFNIVVSVHEQGNPNNTLYRRDFDGTAKQAFELNEPIEVALHKSDPLVWYSFNITGNPGKNLARFEIIRDYYEKYQKYLGNEDATDQPK